MRSFTLPPGFTDRLHVDLETYSPLDLRKVGVYKYAEHPDAEIMLFGYKVNDEPTQVVDLLAGEKIPARVYRMLSMTTVLKVAFNANFERTMLKMCLGIECDPAQWQCTMVHSSYLGFPGGLGEVNERLGVPVDKQKSKEGKRLIGLFCKPCKPTKANGRRTRNMPEHMPLAWLQFKLYCGQDVDAEHYTAGLLNKHPVPAFERRLWALDQHICDRGVQVDWALVDNAVLLHERVRDKLIAEAQQITGLLNPNSREQLLAWLKKEVDPEKVEDFDDLQKKTVARLLGTVNSGPAKRVLEIRQQIAKASITKYKAFQRMRMADGRVRGLLQFYGALRTGRWAGRLVQVHNLPQNKIKNIELVRETLKRGDFDLLIYLYDDIARLLSELLRTAIIAGPRKQLIPVDFSAIEARVIAWLSKEEWRMEVFRTHGMIYEASASQMFNVPLDHIKKGGVRADLRQKGKISELALGFQGADGALKTMGALEMGLVENELNPLVKAWRAANENIVNFWWQVEKDARRAILQKTTVKREHYSYTFEDKCLFLTLPSGRRLCYPKARVIWDKEREREIIVFKGLNQYTRKWEWVKTYAGKLVENMVQAIARDCLAVLQTRLEPRHPICMHVHDEAVCEVDLIVTKEEIEAIAGIPIDWAPGLPLSGGAFCTSFYKKED